MIVNIITKEKGEAFKEEKRGVDVGRKGGSVTEKRKRGRGSERKNKCR